MADARAHELKACAQLTKEVKDAGVKAIAETAEQTDDKLKSITAKVEPRMEESLGKFDAHVQGTLEGVTAEFGEWGRLQQQIGKFKETLGPGLVLFGILKSTEYLRKIQLPLRARNG